MKLLQLAIKSALNRKASLALSVLAIGISIFLLLGVDTIRKQVKQTFLNTISQTDLIVGARSGPENLLLYSVFHIGDATNNIPYSTFEHWEAHHSVKWAVPISLGDSHRGFRVMGTSQQYFDHYRFRDGQSLSFTSGVAFDDIYDAVLGSDVARQLGYTTGRQIVLTHGTAINSMALHDDKPFTVTGILEKTGTPVDQTVFVSLQGIEAIHVDWQGGMRSPLRLSAEQARKMSLRPKTITAFMLGLHRKVETFRVQRAINEYKEEPLLAILPGVTLASLWRSLGQFENVLLAISALVLLTGLAGLLTALLTALNERRREIAVLRATGMRKYQVFLLFVFEGACIVTAGCLLGLLLLYGGLYLLRPLLEAHYGMYIGIQWPDAQQLAIMAAAVALGSVMSLLPGLIAYKRSLQDGLSVRI